MPECARCSAFTDNPAYVEYHYCDDCRSRFAEIEKKGVVVEQDTEKGRYDVIVTDQSASIEGGSENSQEDALARGKYIADECGLEGLFKYERSGSTWVLEEYLEAHPGIRQDVHNRLRRLPQNSSKGFLGRLLGFLNPLS